MPSREYQVEAENVLPEGFWPGEPLEAASRSELEALMLDAAAVLDRIGGTFSIVAIRQQVGEDLWVPVGYRAKWESYAPGRRAPQPAPEPEVEVEAAADPEEEEQPVSDPDMNGAAPPVEEWGPDAESALAAGTV